MISSSGFIRINLLKYFAFILLFLLIIPSAGKGSSLQRPEMIRVALQKGVESVILQGIGILAADENGDP